MDQAEQKQAAQDYRGAANCYEKALDGTAKTADAHFRLGVIYDDKLNDPVGAVHHFRRYLEFLPNGPHAKEAKANLDRIELTLATSLAGGTFITHAEAVRLKNENKDLPHASNSRRAAILATVRFPTVHGGANRPLTAVKRTNRQSDDKKMPARAAGPIRCSPATRSPASRASSTKPRRARRDIQDANLNAVPRRHRS